MKLETQRKLGLILVGISLAIWIGWPILVSNGYKPDNPVAFLLIGVVSYISAGLVGIFLHCEANKKLKQNRWW